MRNSAHCLVPTTCSACFLMASRATSPKAAPPTMGWAGSSTQSSFKKTAQKLAQRPTWWGFFSIDVPSPKMAPSRVKSCHKTLARTDTCLGFSPRFQHLSCPRATLWGGAVRGHFCHSCLLTELQTRSLLGCALPRRSFQLLA